MELVSPPLADLQAPIFLLGFMACGKSTAGRALAQQLGVRFIDLDEIIEQTAEAVIANIINDKGEDYFRQVETDCLGAVAAQGVSVIALGGGAFTQARNRDIIARSGVAVWLDAPFELCWQRIQSDAVVRPLAPTEEEARHRYLQRRPVYELAQVRVVISPLATPAEIAAQILAQFQKV